MNLHAFVESLTEQEKRTLLRILQAPKTESDKTVRQWLEQEERVPMRIRNSLTYSDLVDKKMSDLRDTDLFKLRNFGKKSLKEMIELYPALKTSYSFMY